MDELIKIALEADLSSLKKAEKELGTFQKAFLSLNKVIDEQSKLLTSYSSIVTAIATSFKSIHLAVTNFIITPLAGAVNSFIALGDQISKTSQRIGMSTGTLGGLKFAAEQCGANFQIGTSDKCVPAPFDPQAFQLEVSPSRKS
ncbi:MAG: hypothetical protein Q4A17_05615 [Thermoguttaceae bacterium]|nr:hypothetical protein [Thermoguttaceae bacterium]